MTPSLQLGPLALPAPLVVTAAALALGWLAGTLRGRRRGVDVEPLLARMLLVGLAAARLAFVFEWRQSYAAAPWSVLDLRDGGWDAGFGVAAACLYGLHAARRQHALGGPVVAAVLAAGLAWTAGTLGLALGARPGASLPALVLPSLEGGTVALPELAGQPVVVNLWATWCPPCRREMPVLAQAQAAHPDIRFVFVNQGEPPETVARFLAQQQLRLADVLLDARGEAGAALGRALPTTLFFDARGQLVATRVGELSRATLAQRIAELRGARPAVPEFSLSP